jgi:hypothetical protein
MDNLPPDTCKSEASGEDGMNHVDLFTDSEKGQGWRSVNHKNSNQTEPSPKPHQNLQSLMIIMP